MIRKINMLLILIFILNACSLINSSKEEIGTKPSDESEFTVDTITETPSEVAATEIKVEEQPITESKNVDLIVPEEPKFSDFKKEAIAPEEAPVVVISEKVLPEAMGKEEYYSVQKGDTLMLVAFKLYGDYRKWKDLKKWNSEKLKSKITEGAQLKYFAAEKSFNWRPDGLPYLVKTGDTLQVVSMDKYGTTKKWKKIFENNRPIIRDPNLIFAGFTLYYMPERDIASEHR